MCSEITLRRRNRASDPDQADIGHFARQPVPWEHIRDVGAGVLPPGRLTTNLLGLNVLDRFATWRMEDDRLILEPAG